MMKKWLTLHFYIVSLVADAMEANQCLQTKITQLVSVILLLYQGLNLSNINRHACTLLSVPSKS